jgi:hypothetical protein
MTTPETNPSTPPPAPEADPTIQALEALKAEIKLKTAEMLVETVKNTAANSRDVEIEINKKNDLENPMADPTAPLEGSPNDPDSPQGKARSVQKTVQSIILAALEVPPKTFTPDMTSADRTKLADASKIARLVLEKLAKNIDPLSVTQETAPYLHKLILGLFTGEITSIATLQQKYNSVGDRLAGISSTMFNKLRRSLQEAVIELGVSSKNAENLFADKSTTGEDIKRLLNSQDMNERKILEVIDRDTFGKEKLQLDKFYASMRTAESFNSYYEELYAQYITPDNLAKIEGKVRSRKRNITAEDLKEEVSRLAKEETTKAVHQRIIYLVNLFYKPILVSAPDQDFNRTVSQYGGAYSPSPENMFRQLTSRITGITTARLGNKNNDQIYMAFHQETKDQVIPEQRTTLLNRSPMKEYKECDFDEFARQMKTIAETERGFMEFGHNFRFATNKGPQGDKGFFETIGQFAKESINTNDIDVITAVEYSELVQIAKIQLERRYKLAFAKMRWQRDIRLFREVFEATNKIDKEIRESFIRDFSGDAPDKYPEVIIDRCLSHARTLVYGKEFNLQLWASYADPRLEKGGKPTYSREELSGATAFSPVDDAIRWGDIPDLNNNGELFLPSYGEDPYNIRDHDKAVAKGKKEFHESFTFGYAAFEKAPPTIAEIGNNLTKGGGMDSIGGYRVRQAYEQWLNGLMDERTNNREIKIRDTKDDVMVEAWKRVENIGTNILKNFKKEFILTDTHKAALKSESDPKFKGPKSVTKKYQELYGYWYDRYLSDKDSVGNVYVKGKSKEQYVQEMMKHSMDFIDGKEDEFVKEKYKIMTVVLFERSPLEFVSMEKPRLTQNGVTLLSQVQNQFIEDRDIKAKKLDGVLEFDAATSDLVFIEQKARMDSIQQMDEIRKKNKLNGDELNLYGDKSKSRSEVLQMDGWAKNKKGGYVIDEVYIENVLNEQYKNDPEDVRKWKVERAKRLYRGIQEGMKKTPDNNTEIEIFVADGKDENEKKANTAAMRKKLKEKEKNMGVRMDWWADAWKDYKFGMTFTADTADQFMDRSRTGEDTIYQATEFCANAAEVMKKHFLVGMKKACKQAAMERNFKPLYDYLKEIKDPIDGQDDGLSQKMIQLMMRRMINTMRKDERALAMGGDLSDAMSGRTGSISETYTGEENFTRVWSWDRNDIGDFIEGAHGKTSGKILSDKKEVKKMKRYGHAKFFDILKHHLLPITGLAMVSLLAFIAYQASKQDG